ncbi:hypothetical protein GCM10027277_46780 [Pseudoduganella ginsengisoli]|uniref:NrS-1 polymerase-like helicase domain-containing protein n=1 Tax=Pseudoduganella ginsengisoli TaxID=1462440 RepID=A0A6L6Q3F8_9BURK|nr:primase-helicase family protein [Pseudoduganella ginsengisoli]MTW04135.1 hypothetical protein [Pseudoduganella ginsengisoli]
MTEAAHAQPKPATQRTKTHDSIVRYRTELKSKGYCKLFNKNSDRAQFVNPRTYDNPRPAAWAGEDFLNYCHENDLEVPGNYELSDLVRGLDIIIGKVFDPKDKRKIVPLPGTRDFQLNVYRPFIAEKDPIALDDTFHAFFKALIKNEKERKILFQYIAHMVQRPWERPSWHIMLPSDSGTGKGFLLNDILNKIIPNNWIVGDFKSLKTKFSAKLETGILVWLDDPDDANPKTQKGLKTILSEERQLAEEKYGTERMVNCYARMILASNEAIPLHIDDQERRWCVFEKLTYCNNLSAIDGKQHRIDNYIRPLSNWLMVPGAIEAVHKFFNEYPLDDFDHKKVPITASYLALVEQSKSTEQVMLEEWIETLPADKKYFRFEEAQKVFEHTQTPCPRPQTLKTLLEICGFQSYRFKNKHAHMGSLWFPLGMTKEQVIHCYEAPSF